MGQFGTGIGVIDAVRDLDTELLLSGVCTTGQGNFR
jgi:hypothetical protein